MTSENEKGTCENLPDTLDDKEKKAREKRIKAFETKAKKLLKQAMGRGLEHDFYFSTVFANLQEQIRIMYALSEKIWELGVVIEKEYVKGRPCLVTNPAVQDYNKTCTAANSTVSTLMNIIKAFDKGPETNEESKFNKFMQRLEE